MIAECEVSELFREVLYREPSIEDLQNYTQNGPDAAWLRDTLASSLERTDIVDPLQNVLTRKWNKWLFRNPTHDELSSAIQVARHNFPGEENLKEIVDSSTGDKQLGFRPLNMEIDITNNCNLRCVMCNFSDPRYYKVRKQEISVEKFEELASQVFPRMNKISLSFGAEPLLHRKIEQLFAILADYKVPYTYMHTNGLLLRKSSIEAMIKHRFSSLSISIDAATKETYENIRIGGKFEKLIANLHLLKKIKAEHGVEHPTLSFNFVIMRQNMHELPAFIDMAAELGAIGVNATHMIAWDRVGNVDMAATHEKERFNTFLAQAQQRAKEHGIPLVAPEPFELESKVGLVVSTYERSEEVFAYDTSKVPETLACPFPWVFVAVDMKGNVVPCGWWYNEQPMGNIHKLDFYDIWRGKPYERLRQRLEKSKLKGACSKCPAAGMGRPDAKSSFSKVKVTKGQLVNEVLEKIESSYPVIVLKNVVARGKGSR